MFILIKLVILAFLALVVFFVPLGSRPLYGHLHAIWSTPETQELKRELTKNALLLETWLESHRALSGEPHPLEVKPGSPETGNAGPRESVAPLDMNAPVNEPMQEPAMRRPRRTGGGKTRGETR
jgi:hypothetical protein